MRYTPVGTHMQIRTAHAEGIELGLAADVRARIDEAADAGSVVWRDIS